MTLDQMKIPENAMPVVALLRERVKRPEKLPISDGGGPFRWENVNMRTIGWNCCPMGFFPEATYECPYMPDHLPGLNLQESAIDSFANWWDNLLVGWDEPVGKDLIAQRAVDLIWGET